MCGSSTPGFTRGYSNLALSEPLGRIKLMAKSCENILENTQFAQLHYMVKLCKTMQK
jgi:hypothetical protein